MKPVWALSLIIMTFIIQSCADGGPLKFGLIAGLTGPGSELSVCARNGVALALEDCNRKGGLFGHPVLISVQDDGNWESGGEAAIEHFRREGVELAIGPMTSVVAQGVLNAVSNSPFLIISPTVSAVCFGGKDDPFFRMVPDTRLQAQALAEYAYHHRMRRVFLLAEERNGAYSEEVTDYFREHLEARGGRICGKQLLKNGDLAGMEKAVDRIAASSCDVVLSVFSASDTALISQLLAKKGVRKKLMAGTWSMTGDLIQKGGGSVEGMILAGIEGSGDQNERYLEFSERYRSRYGTEPPFSAILGYESAAFLFEAVRRAGSRNPDQVKLQLLAIRDYPGIYGPIHLDAYGDIERNYSVFVVKQGEFVRADGL